MIRDGCDIRDVVEGGGAVWTEDGGVDGTRRKSETGFGRAWTRVWMEDEGQRDWVWTGVDGGVDGRRRGARLGVKRCGPGCGWTREGSDWVWTGVWTDGGERDWV